MTLGGVGAAGAAIVIPIFGTLIAPGALGGVILNGSISTFLILGRVILGASIGLFGSGFTVGASNVCTTGAGIFNVTACLFTSFGEIRASISTSLVGSFKSSKSTNPHPLFPFVDEPIEASLFMVTPPFETFPAFAHELWESFPGVNGVPPTLELSRVSIAFLVCQFPLVYIPLKEYLSALSPLPLYVLPQFS